MKQSAGILLYRQGKGGVEVLLAHPGGPFWAKKDTWSIPKGELNDDEDHLPAAYREFKEEIGVRPPGTGLIELGEIKQDSSKINYIWAVEGDLELKDFVCHSTFEIEWPPRSGEQQQFVEIDRVAWFSLNKAKQKLFKAQAEFIDRLATKLAVPIDDETASDQQISLL